MKQEFKLFDPKKCSLSLLPNIPGNYIILLRPNSQLPKMEIIPEIQTIEIQKERYSVIYTGISKSSIRIRDYKQHFIGNNAGKSTLRKSLGSLMGFAKIPRDKNKPDNKKTKFNEQDESLLTLWMTENLLLFYCAGNTFEDIELLEIELINKYNPPLNIKNNKNLINKEYRIKLTELRVKGSPLYNESCKEQEIEKSLTSLHSENIKNSTIMNWSTLKEQVITEYNSRNLKSKTRYHYLDKIETFLKDYHPLTITEVESLRQINKESLKVEYANSKGTKINDAESSVINEIYKQLLSL